MPRLLSSLLLLAAASQTACVQLAEMDASQLPRYQTMIGQQFTLKEDMKVMGVKRDLRSKLPDYAMLVGSPGIGGPEFIELGSKPAGSRFSIVGVVTYKSKLFPGTAYVVRFADGREVAPGIKDIRITDQNGFGFHIKMLSHEVAPQLNDRYFTSIAPGE